MSTTKSSPKRARQRGRFISFEGGEGVGKTTQIQLLVNRLKELQVPVITSREPGGTPGAEAIRKVLLDEAAVESFGPKLEALLLSAARNDHVNQVIRPALESGTTVIVDRFMDSTRVYQGASSNLPPSFVANVERLAVAEIIPDLTLILDLDPKTGLARAASRRADGTRVDRFEKETLTVHNARRRAFRQIAAAEPERCKLIDADGTPEEIHALIWPHVENLLRSADKKPAARTKASAAGAVQ
ncbi:MAG: dTMP kinase [Pseudomonadota bacterium]